MAIPTIVVTGKPDSHSADLLALLVREGEKWPAVDGPLEGLFARCAKEEEFTGKEGQVLSLHTHGKLGAARLKPLIFACTTKKDENDKMIAQPNPFN